MILFTYSELRTENYTFGFGANKTKLNIFGLISNVGYLLQKLTKPEINANVF